MFTDFRDNLPKLVTAFGQKADADLPLLTEGTHDILVSVTEGES